MEVSWRDVILGLSCFGSLCPGSLLLLAIVVSLIGGFRKPPAFPRGES